VLGFLRRKYNLYVSPNKGLTKKIKNTIYYEPKRLHLFELAFHHKSLNNGDTIYPYSNERLEYLGDAFLSVVVAEYLFHKYPFKDEGFLTKMRSKIVKRKTLNELANKIGLDVILADYAIGTVSKTMAGNAFEALVGAIYLDMGYRKGKSFIIQKFLIEHLDIEELEQKDDNYKSQLLEWSQKTSKMIEFKLVSKSKAQGRDRFRMAVSIDEELISEGEAFNKKAAEQKAAHQALKRLKVPDDKTP
jgi:ribonuclease-3